MVSQIGSLGYTIMLKTADLTVVQKTIIDTLHNEGKPQQARSCGRAWTGLGPPTLTAGPPNQKKIKNKILLCIVKHGYYFMWCISSITCYVKNSKIISKPDNFKI